MQKLRLRVRRVDDEILAAVRSQSTGGARAKADLAQAQSAIGSLEHRVADIKRKAESSEATVREICADVKKLDFAKKHLTSTITSLRRLSMLVNAVDQLERFASKRAYEESANLLDAANELAAHFERYSDVPKVAELKRRRDDCESALRAAVFEDFHVNWQPSVVASDASVAARLRDACAVVDALDPKHRDALTGDLTNKELTGYASVFDKSTGAGGDSKGLDQVERRYAWIKRNLKAKEAMWGVFPEHWRFPQLLCMSLCKLTRAHLAELLDAEARAAEVQTVLQAMHKTVAFERDLDDHFGVDATLGTTLGRAEEASAADAFDSALGDDADAALGGARQTRGAAAREPVGGAEGRARAAHGQRRGGAAGLGALLPRRRLLVLRGPPRRLRGHGGEAAGGGARAAGERGDVGRGEEERRDEKKRRQKRGRPKERSDQLVAPGVPVLDRRAAGLGGTSPASRRVRDPGRVRPAPVSAPGTTRAAASSRTPSPPSRGSRRRARARCSAARARCS